MSQVPIEIIALEVIRLDETTEGIILICPSCGNRSNVDGDQEGFRFLEDIVCFRQIHGVRRNSDGALHLRIDGLYESGEGYDYGSGARIECRSCLGEFAIPESLDLSFE